MFVRLAFSVAAHLEPEILLVDEVLAVGDAEFQRKCIGKMESVGRGGRTVIFVSHSMPAIARLCSRALLMHNGQLVADGPSDEVVARYLQGEVGSPSLRSWEPDAAPGDDLVRLREVAVVDGGGETVESTDVRDPVGIRFEFDVLAFGAPIVPQIMVTNEQGLHCFNAFDTNPRWHEPTPPGRHTVTAWLPGNLLNEGLMSVTVFLSTLTSGRTIQHVLERDIVSFHVTDPVEGDSSKGTWAGQWGGAVRPLLLWTPESSLRQDERVGLRLLDGREVV
jgi:lipopolysaccharide transport system ATP-binding protein